jgi:hypothetical protein
MATLARMLSPERLAPAFDPSPTPPVTAARARTPLDSGNWLVGVWGESDSVREPTVCQA